MYKIGVLLSGCGVLDGSEIHESVLTLLALEKQDMEYICIAPDKEQNQTINHLNNKPTNEKRNMLVEAARIARGEITNLKDIKPDELDAVIMPGGFGAACNLSTFAKEGPNAQILPEVEEFLVKMHKLKKPIGAICIAPNILAKVFGKLSPSITIGNDKNTAVSLEKMGAQHLNKMVDEIVIDKENLFVSTPAYMLAKSIKELEPGINSLVKAIKELIKNLKSSSKEKILTNN